MLVLVLVTVTEPMAMAMALAVVPPVQALAAERCRLSAQKATKIALAVQLLEKAQAAPLLPAET